MAVLSFVAKTYAEILTDMLSRVPNTIDKREGSIIDESLRPAGWAIEGIYLDLVAIQRDAYVTTAVGDALDYKVAERGIYRKQATKAVRLGEFNLDIELGSRFSTINGSESVIFEVTKKLGQQSNGYYHCELTAETAGTIGNAYTGQILPVSPTYVNGLTRALILDIILAGTNTETDEELRARYIFDLSRKPFAGNIAAYIKWFTGVDEQDAHSIYSDRLGTVMVLPHTQLNVGEMRGYVVCSVLDGNYDPISADLIDILQQELDPTPAPDQEPLSNGVGYTPIGASVSVTTPEELMINVTADITLRAGYTVEELLPRVEEAIRNYFLEIRRDFGNSNDPYFINSVTGYTKYVYVSRVQVAILSVQGIANATNVNINGDIVDITLTSNGLGQHIPSLGTVTLNAI